MKFIELFSNHVRVRGGVLAAPAILFAMLAAAWGGPLDDGNAAYARGDYSAAIRSYETALATLGPSPGLYFNLAGAQAKEGLRAEAVLSLRRSLLLDTRYTDARMALSDLERSLGVPLRRGGWKEMLAERVPLRALFGCGLAAAWAGAFMILYAAFIRRTAGLIVAAGVLLLGGGALLIAGHFADPRVSEKDFAVIVAGSGASLLSAPADQSATVERLPAGSALKVVRDSGEWTFCETPSGQKGWTSSNALKRVVPAA